MEAADLSSKHSSSINLYANPEFKSFIDKITKFKRGVARLTLPLHEQRKLDAQFISRETHCDETVYRTENIEILGYDHNKIPIRIYFPNNSKNLPVILYFHGGGWVFGGIEESDAVCRRLANHLRCNIASVGYRLAPEFPFPKPLEDCYAATQWMADNAHQFGAGDNSIIVCGESAGGNMAAAVSLMARDKQGPKISAQLLLYPAISSVIKDEIYDQCPDHYFLTKDIMKYFWDMYTQSSEDNKNPYASLDNGMDFHNLPPALIVTAEYDPLSFETEKYAEKLIKANVKVIAKTFPGLIHGFLYIPLYPENQKVQWTKEIGRMLHKLI